MELSGEADGSLGDARTTKVTSCYWPGCRDQWQEALHQTRVSQGARSAASAHARALVPAPGAYTKISYLADHGGPLTTVYENQDFRITAACNSTFGPNAILRPKVDNGGWAQSATAANTTNALYFQDPVADVGDNFLIQFFNLAEEAGTITYVSPGGARVTTITYLINYQFATRNCVFVGNAVTL